MFKKECIHCVPDESLVGKYVIYGDTYKEIMANLTSSNWKTLRKKIVNVSDNRDIPFEVECGAYTRTILFVYYDPEWDEKDEETVYYCVLVRGEHRSHFSYTSEKLDTHIYAEYTRIGDALDWCYSHDKFAEIAKAWEDGKTICGRNITNENQYCTDFVKCHETNEKFIQPVWCESCIKWIIKY